MNRKNLKYVNITFICGLFLPVICLFFGCGKPDKSEQEEFTRHSSLGISYLNQGKYDDAVAEFRQALKIKPRDLPTIINLGLSYHHNYKYAEAEEVFKMALAIDTDEPYSHYNLGWIYREQGEYDKAVAEFEQAAAVDSTDPAVRYNLGTAYLKGRQYDKAAEEFRRVIDSHPDSAPAYYSLSRALMNLKKMEEAKEVLTKFQQLKTAGLAGAEREKYLREGKYLEPVVTLEETPLKVVQAPSKVYFVDATESAGLTRIRDEKNLPPSERDKDHSLSLLSSVGSGVAFADYDNDGHLDLYIVNCSPQRSANSLYRNNGDGTFKDVTTAAGVGDTGLGMGCAWGDYDNDGNLDLYVTNVGANALYRNNGDGTFKDVTAETRVGDTGFGAGVAIGDYDADGDLDIYVANYVDVAIAARSGDAAFRDLPGQANVLYRNNGNGTFTDVTTEAGVSGERKSPPAPHLSKGGRSLSVLFTDYDNDRDVDIYVVNDGEPDILYSNNRDGTFKAAEIAESEDGKGAALGDYNNDGNMDIFVTGGTVTANNLRQGTGSAFTNILQLGTNGWGACFLDYDNDGDLDIFATGEKNQLFRNNDDGKFTDVSAESKLNQIVVESGRGVAGGDYDNDGDTDIIIVSRGGYPTLLRNEGGNDNNWLKVKVVGLRSNKSAIGTKVEVKAGTLWQKREITAGCGYLSQGSLVAEFGLGKEDRVDIVGITLPSGLRQFIADVPANMLTTINETPHTSTSCPHLFAWDGAKYRFVTDFIGSGALGYLIAPGLYHQSDSNEYVKIETLNPKDGYYSLQILNSLQEVVYLDKVRLLTIDHPAEVDVYPNERFMTEAPLPEFYIHKVRDAKPPISAVDDEGNDVLPLISAKDRKYPDFELLSYKGYAQTHSIILDLGDMSKAERITLIIYGWVEYPESYSNLAASQGGVQLILPSLSVPDEDGEWRTVIKNMGFPAGLPKYMTVDVTGKFLTRDYRVKITTNMQIYWDAILVNTFAEKVPLHTNFLRAKTAHLHWKGYPKPFSPDGRKPYAYDYDDVSETEFWDSHIGEYTKPGPVTKLLAETDDKYVIMPHGYEITVSFDAVTRPKLPAGWKRDFFFYADGFSKDMDLNTTFSATVEPLPSHLKYTEPKSDL